jgi:hypothetical protein
VAEGRVQGRAGSRRRLGGAFAGLVALAGGGALSVLQAPAAFAGTSSFAFTGALQSFTVPAGVTSVTVVAEGAQGGGTVGAGGRGASIG